MRFLKNLLKKYSAIEIYTDGSHKDGFGSWAYIISRQKKVVAENSGRVARASSNAMEFQAAIEALSSININSFRNTNITLYSDSRILVDCMKFGKGPEAHQVQIDQLISLNQKFNITWKWVKAHNGNIFNERCDELCTLARAIKVNS